MVSVCYSWNKGLSKYKSVSRIFDRNDLISSEEETEMVADRTGIDKIFHEMFKEVMGEFKFKNKNIPFANILCYYGWNLSGNSKAKNPDYEAKVDLCLVRNLRTIEDYSQAADPNMINFQIYKIKSDNTLQIIPTTKKIQNFDSMVFKNFKNPATFESRSAGMFGYTPNLLTKTFEPPSSLQTQTFEANSHKFFLRTNHSLNSSKNDILKKNFQPTTYFYENLDSRGGRSQYVDRFFGGLDSWVLNMTVWLGAMNFSNYEYLVGLPCCMHYAGNVNRLICGKVGRGVGVGMERGGAEVENECLGGGLEVDEGEVLGVFNGASYPFFNY